MCGWGCSFSMLQMFCCYKSEKVHFVAFFDTFCRIFRQPFSCKSGTFAPNFKAR